MAHACYQELTCEYERTATRVPMLISLFATACTSFAQAIATDASGCDLQAGVR